MPMRPIDVIRRPLRCPKCGGEVCDIIWGMPIVSWKEDHLKATGHNAVLGGCCLKEGGYPGLRCEDCGQEFNQLSFPSKSKAFAREALLQDEDSIFCDVEYVGLYKKQMVYTPVVKEGICWDGIILVFVDETGKAKVRDGLSLIPIIQKIHRDKEKLNTHSEFFYRMAAKRSLKDDYFYDNVRRCGMYKGKRAYEPVLKEEFKNDPPVIGLPLVILVDRKGRPEFIRDFLSFDIYDQLRKKRK